MELVRSDGAWARRRFGAAEEALRGIVPRAMAEADALAFRSSVEGEIRTGHVYGTAFWLKSNEILIELAQQTPGLSVRRLRHVRRYFECVVVDETSTVLLPVRIDSVRGQEEKIRLHNPPSTSLAYLLGPPAVQDQPDTLDNELFGVADLVDQASDLRELDRQLSDFAAVVAIGAECSKQNGLARLEWGDLQLVDGERLSVVWSHSEPLEFLQRGVDLAYAEARTIAVGETIVPNQSTPAFDDLGLDEVDALDISLRREKE